MEILGYLIIRIVVYFPTYLILHFAEDDSSQHEDQEHGMGGKDQTYKESDIVKQTTTMKETIVTKIINNEQLSNVSNAEGQREEITNKEPHGDITEHNTQKKNIKNIDFSTKDADRAILVENVTPRTKSLLTSQISSSAVFHIEHTSPHAESQSPKVPAPKDTRAKENKKATAIIPDLLVENTTPTIHRQSTITSQSTSVYLPTPHTDLKNKIPENVIANSKDASRKVTVLKDDLTTQPVTIQASYNSTTTTPAVSIRLSTSDILRQKLNEDSMLNANNDAENMLEGNVETHDKSLVVNTKASRLQRIII